MRKEKRIKFVEREASRSFLITMSKVTVPNENSQFLHCTLTHYEKYIGNKFFSHNTEGWVCTQKHIIYLCNHVRVEITNAYFIYVPLNFIKSFITCTENHKHVGLYIFSSDTLSTSIRATAAARSCISAGSQPPPCKTSHTIQATNHPAFTNKQLCLF